jgi:hypothetical protein
VLARFAQGRLDPLALGMKMVGPLQDRDLIAAAAHQAGQDEPALFFLGAAGYDPPQKAPGAGELS